MIGGIMKRVCSSVLGAFLGIVIVFPCVAMDPPPKTVLNSQDYRDNIKVGIYKRAAQDIVTYVFAETKDTKDILQRLLTKISFYFPETWNSTSLRYDFHIQKFMEELITEALAQYNEKRSTYSITKEYAWGSSNKLLVLGVLKQVATNLSVVLPSTVEASVNRALSYLHFYSSKIDPMGIKAFNENLGTFNSVDPNTYLKYSLCMTYVDLISQNIFNYVKNTSKVNSESVNKESNEDVQYFDTMDFLSVPIQKNQYPSINAEGDDWKKMDEYFQQYIIEIGKNYNMSAYYREKSQDPLVRVPAENIIEFCSNSGQIIPDPEQYRQKSLNYKQITTHNPLPPGDYAKATKCAPWMQSVRFGNKAERGQGLKIHVSAKPETALKIAKIAIPIINANNIEYKVMYDLRYMRKLYYLSQYESLEFLTGDGQSTQAGKFIAIYPRDLNEARDIIQKLEDAFKKHHLHPDDFVKLVGDAQVGDTGGIFARYGKFTRLKHKGRPSNSITPVDEFNVSIPPDLIEKETGGKYDPSLGVPDERIYPWPDYMNNRNLFKQPLFGNLSVTWVNPNNPQQVITWDKRPNCWAELNGIACN
jgi:hypothetical protein